MRSLTLITTGLALLDLHSHLAFSTARSRRRVGVTRRASATRRMSLEEARAACSVGGRADLLPPQPPSAGRPTAATGEAFLPNFVGGVARRVNASYGCSGYCRRTGGESDEKASDRPGRAKLLCETMTATRTRSSFRPPPALPPPQPRSSSANSHASSHRHLEPQGRPPPPHVRDLGARLERPPSPAGRSSRDHRDRAPPPRCGLDAACARPAGAVARQRARGHRHPVPGVRPLILLLLLVLRLLSRLELTPLCAAGSPTSRPMTSATTWRAPTSMSAVTTAARSPRSR